MYPIIALSVAVPVILTVFFAWQRQRKSPEKSFKNCAINVILTPFRMLKLGPFKYGKLTIDDACKYAVKKTGLSDFGEDKQFLELYKGMMDHVSYKSLKLTNIGYISARVEIQMTMVRRLKFIDYLKKNPEVLNVPVRTPVFVLGLPRSGTTFLHRLLSIDPQVRAPLLWELLAPVPGVPGNASKDEMSVDLEKRANFIRKLVSTRKEMGDKALEHIHEIGADLPEECLMTLNDDLPILMHMLYSDYMGIGHYEKVVTVDKSAKAYKHYKKYLQLMSYQMGERSDPRRWMLKCPIHLFYIRAIAQAFPDAKLVWTHRHPKSSVTSLCSLLKSLHQVYYEVECRNDEVLGKAIRDVSAKRLAQAPKDIEETGLDCSHTTYEELVKDPVATVKKIYQHFNWTYSEEYDTLLKKFLKEDKEKRDAIKKRQASSGEALHTYDPAEFGLTEQELSVGPFKEYVDRFCTPGK